MPRRITRKNSNPLVQWWWRLDRLLLVQLVLLGLFGIAVMSSASAGVAGTYDVDPYYFFKKQLVFLVATLTGMIVLTMLPLRLLKMFGIALLLGALGGVFLTLVIGVDVKGASRWLDLGAFRLQPSEFLKVGFIIISGWLLAKDEGRGFWFSGLLLALCCGLLLLQPDFGLTMLLCAVWLGQIFLAGVPVVFLFPLVVGVFMLIIGAYVTLPHVRSRFDRFFDPEGGDTYQLDKAREAILEGGLSGRGPGEGVIKSTLPDAHTDFIYAVVIEEYGLIVALFVLMLFAWLVLRALWRSGQQEDRFRRIVGGGLALLIGLQVLINVSVVLGLIPTTGMPLPFISYGGSATLALGVAAGCLLALLHKPLGQVGSR